MKSCRRCVVKGRVQGVFFRQSTLDQAERLGIKGWVRNLDNGDVECIICGENNLLEQMIAWLHKGPPSAKVSNLEIVEMPWEEHQDFLIRR
jgi:acylphosphatase